MIARTASAADIAAHKTREAVERVRREFFPRFDFSEAGDGLVATSFFRSRLTSAFQPIVGAADSGIAGRQGVLRVFDGAGAAVAPWGLFAQAASDEELVSLDRLARTIHAVNHLRASDGESSLFLHVEPRLLSSIREDHGAWFEQVLGILGFSTRHVTIVLPPAALDDPATFVRASISYRIRGYRVAARLRTDASADLSHVFLAEPHFVAIDAPTAARPDAGTRNVVATLARQGIRSIARRVGSKEQAEFARAAGFDFLQGWHFASRPMP